MENNDVAFLCPFCNCTVYLWELDPEVEDKLEMKISTADSFILCEDCQCEILYDSETLNVVTIQN